LIQDDQILNLIHSGKNLNRILITGANSFIGTNFRKFSRFRDIEEISLLENKPENIDFTGYDIVLHLAAIVHQSKKISEEIYFSVNRDLCLKVAEQAKKGKVKHFIFLSTVKVYGDFASETSIWNEDSICIPGDSYGKSKLEAEIGLRKLQNSDFAVSILRTPLVYGEGVTANMNSLIRLIETVPVLPFNKVYNKRSFTYIENLVGFIDQIILKKSSGVFIAIDGKAISTTELLNYISKHLGKRIILFKLPGIIIRIGKSIIPRIFDRLYGSLEVDNTKTLKDLDFKPPFTTDEGIRRMILAYKKGTGVKS
jgi:nucleoside-diphosphate-sugar epimerase